MATKNNHSLPTSEMKIISMRHLGDKAGISRVRIFHHLNQRYNSLSADERVRVVNALYEEVSKVFNALGFHIPEPRRIKDQAH